MSMNISMGLDGTDTPERIRELTAGGADEFFAGYIPAQWLRRYGWEAPLNRRSYGPECQFLRAGDLREAVETVHAEGKRIFLTLNHHAYAQEQVPLIRDIVAETEAIEPDGYIVADPALMVLLTTWGITRPLHLSTGAGCYNSETVRYLCSLANVRRVVIPRKMSLHEMSMLIESLNDLDLEFEAMMIGYRCYFNDEFCFSLHSAACDNLCGTFCYARYATSRRWPRDWKTLLADVAADIGGQFQKSSALDRFLQQTSMATEQDACRPPPWRQLRDEQGTTSAVADIWLQNCGLCLIPELRDIGVSVLKIPTRGSSWLKQRFLEPVRAIADHPQPTQEFCRSFVGSPDFCEQTGHCYYARAAADRSVSPGRP